MKQMTPNRTESKMSQNMMGFTSGKVPSYELGHTKKKKNTAEVLQRHSAH